MLDLLDSQLSDLARHRISSVVDKDIDFAVEIGGQGLGDCGSTHWCEDIRSDAYGFLRADVVI